MVDTALHLILYNRKVSKEKLGKFIYAFKTFSYNEKCVMNEEYKSAESY